MSQSIILRSFAGGEISPKIEIRADLPKRTIAARTLKNFLLEKSGAIANRPGWGFIEGCKDNTSGKFLVPYLADDPNESILIEAGNGYLRFYKDGARVEVTHASVTNWSNATNYTVGDLADDGGVVYYCILAHINQQPPNATYWYALADASAGVAIYEIPSPFTAGFYWHQSGPIITLTNTGVTARELVFIALTRWVLSAVSIGPAVAAPTNVTFTAGTVGAGPADQNQIGITAFAPVTFEESLVAVSSRAQAVFPTPTAPNIYEWTKVTHTGVDCPEYGVYRDTTGSGTLEFIGTCKTNALGSGSKVRFLDTGFLADPAITPPINDIDLTSSNMRPGVSATHQQRRCFAHTITTPDAMYASRVGQRANFTRSSPLQDDDSLAIRMAQNQNHAIRHLVSVAAGLAVLTTNGVHRIVSGEGAEGPLTPSSLDAIQDLYFGASTAKPVVAGNAILFVEARGRALHDLRYDQQIDGLGGRDLTILAEHLVQGFTVPEIVYQQNDNSIVWARRSDGRLLGMTYLREQDIYGWHQHVTSTAAGESDIESLAVVPEEDEDVLYAVIARSVGGSTVRYIERLESREISTLAADAIFLDSSLSLVSGGTASSLTGLDHLEGQTVGVVANGVYIGTFTVSSGTVTLGDTYTVPIHAGLLYESDLETLDLDIADSDVRARKKRVGGASLLLWKSDRQFQVGTTTGTLAAQPAPTDGISEFSGLVPDIPLTTSWNDEGRVFLRMARPLPLTILSVIPMAETGG